MRLEITKLLFTEVEAAKYLNISVSTLQKSRTKGDIRIANGLAPAFVKHLGGVRYSVEVLRQYKAEKGAKGFYTELETSYLPNQSKAPAIPTSLDIEQEEDQFDWSVLVESSVKESVRI
ncbi:helix-turn-helix domain-containing protein [Shewanella sp. 1CM18E]|uniref:helix-turn-helix domain-containing protein n=1 Tax=Shewanella sp. 1CM18E TaxID=2929169 RepID=UPI0020BF5A10|nr:helix-turn-helix domain-containing protein [Shewanella sp. 1CM18E]MCK8043759.1 helix-turn-helix domain-containing protein [Shewanella sp. 1CM18E]